MKVVLFAAILLALYLTVHSAPAGTEDKIMDLTQQAQACAQFLTKEGKDFVDTVRENEEFQQKVLKAAEALEQHSIDEQDLSEAAVKAFKMAAYLVKDKGYHLEANPIQAIMPNEGEEDDTTQKCRELIESFIVRNES
ncbi:uncharacterized protein LOC144654570 [Oculina patagonica]